MEAVGDFTLTTDSGEHRARNVVVAIGFFDQPNLLNVPGEDLPKVTHYYREPYPYVRQKVAVIGRAELGGEGGARLLPARR